MTVSERTHKSAPNSAANQQVKSDRSADSAHHEQAAAHQPDPLALLLMRHGGPAAMQGALLSVQRTAGNQAARRLIARRQTAGTRVPEEEEALPDVADAEGRELRDFKETAKKTPTTLAETRKSQGIGETHRERFGGRLTESERLELRIVTGGRVRDSIHYFMDACQDNRAAVKAAAKESSDFLGLVLEVGLGFLLPVISRGIAHLAEELPANASNRMYRVALAALDEERTKKALEIGVKAGKALLAPPVQLEGEDEIDQFLNRLKSNYAIAADKIDVNLSTLTDEELGVMCAAYSPSVAGPEHFRAAVHELVDKFQKQVQTIGTHGGGWAGSAEWRNSLFRIVFPDASEKLAVLKSAGLDKYELSAYVDPELEAFALEKFRSLILSPKLSHDPKRVPATNVDGIPLRDWHRRGMPFYKG